MFEKNGNSGYSGDTDNSSAGVYNTILKPLVSALAISAISTSAVLASDSVDNNKASEDNKDIILSCKKRMSKIEADSLLGAQCNAEPINNKTMLIDMPSLAEADSMPAAENNTQFILSNIFKNSYNQGECYFSFEDTSESSNVVDPMNDIQPT